MITVTRRIVYRFSWLGHQEKTPCQNPCPPANRDPASRPQKPVPRILANQHEFKHRTLPELHPQDIYISQFLNTLNVWNMLNDVTIYFKEKIDVHCSPPTPIYSDVTKCYGVSNHQHLEFLRSTVTSDAPVKSKHQGGHVTINVACLSIFRGAPFTIMD